MDLLHTILVADAATLLLNYSQAAFSRTQTTQKVDPRRDWAYYDTGTPTAASNVPRIMEDGAVLLEGAATNLLLRSNEFGNTGVWGSDGTKTGSQSDPAGGTTAIRIQVSSGGSGPAQIYNADVALASIVSIYVRKGSGAYYTAYGHKAGVGQKTNGTAPTDWTRVTTSVASICRYNLCEGRSEATILTGGVEPAHACDAVFYGAQAETTVFPTSPILTTTVTITRDADIMSFFSAPNPLRMSNWTVSVWPLFDSTEAPSTAYIYYLDANNYLAIVGGTTLRLRANGTNFDRTVAYARYQELKVHVFFSAGTFSVDNGSTVSVTEDWSAATGTLYVGADNAGTSNLFGVLGRPRRSVNGNTPTDFVGDDLSAVVWCRGDDAGNSISGFTLKNRGSGSDWTSSSGKPGTRSVYTGTKGRRSIDFNGVDQKCLSGPTFLSVLPTVSSNFWASGVVVVDGATSTDHTWLAHPVYIDSSAYHGVLVNTSGIYVYWFDSGVKVTTEIAIPYGEPVYWEVRKTGSSLFMIVGFTQSNTVTVGNIGSNGGTLQLATYDSIHWMDMRLCEIAFAPTPGNDLYNEWISNMNRRWGGGLF